MSNVKYEDFLMIWICSLAKVVLCIEEINIIVAFIWMLACITAKWRHTQLNLDI